MSAIGRRAGESGNRKEQGLPRDWLYGPAFLLLAAALVVVALRGGGYWLLIWPAISFAAVALAYLSGDVRWFGKRPAGSRHILAILLLLPYLAWAHLVWSLQVALSREPATSEVNPHLVISRRLRNNELPAGIAAVCDLTSEFTDPVRFRSALSYVSYPILDAGITEADELAAFALSLPPPRDGKLLIHCANGHGRTGMVAAIWLLAHGFARSAEDAMQQVCEARPDVKLRKRQRHLVTAAEEWLRTREEVESRK